MHLFPGNEVNKTLPLWVPSLRDEIKNFDSNQAIQRITEGEANDMVRDAEEKGQKFSKGRNHPMGSLHSESGRWTKTGSHRLLWKLHGVHELGRRSMPRVPTPHSCELSCGLRPWKIGSACP